MRERERDEAAWDALYAPLLTTLGAAQEPLPLDPLITWSGVQASPHQVRRLLWERWRAFVYELPADGQAVYRPYHASLRDFLHGRLDEEQSRRLVPADEALVREPMERTRNAHRCIAEYYRAGPARWHEHDGYGPMPTGASRCGFTNGATKSKRGKRCSAL